MTAKSKPAADRQSAALAAMRRTWLLVGGAIAATGLGLAACAPTPPAPAPTPPPPPVVTPSTPPPPDVSVPPANWPDVPITAGDWSYRADAQATRAIFSSTDGVARFVVACELPTRTIRLWREASAPANTALTIATTSQTRSFPVVDMGGDPPMVSTALSPQDRFIDAMVFTRGRFAVAMPGTQPLYLPSWAEVARVTEDCR